MIHESDREALHYDDLIELVSNMSKRELSPLSMSLPKPKQKDLQLNLQGLNRKQTPSPNRQGTQEKKSSRSQDRSPAFGDGSILEINFEESDAFAGRGMTLRYPSLSLPLMKNQEVSSPKADTARFRHNQTRSGSSAEKNELLANNSVSSFLSVGSRGNLVDNETGLVGQVHFRSKTEGEDSCGGNRPQNLRKYKQGLVQRLKSLDDDRSKATNTSDNLKTADNSLQREKQEASQCSTRNTADEAMLTKDQSYLKKQGNSSYSIETQRFSNKEDLAGDDSHLKSFQSAGTMTSLSARLIGGGQPQTIDTVRIGARRDEFITEEAEKEGEFNAYSSVRTFGRKASNTEVEDKQERRKTLDSQGSLLELQCDDDSRDHNSQMEGTVSRSHKKQHPHQEDSPSADNFEKTNEQFQQTPICYDESPSLDRPLNSDDGFLDALKSGTASSCLVSSQERTYRKLEELELAAKSQSQAELIRRIKESYSFHNLKSDTQQPAINLSYIDEAQYRDLLESNVLSAIIEEAQILKLTESLVSNRALHRILHSDLLVLNLSTNNLVSSSFLANLPKLLFLNVSNNELQELDALSNCHDLEEVIFSHNKIVHAPDLSNSTNLRLIDASFNQINSLESLVPYAQNEKLVIFNLFNNPITRKMDLQRKLKELLPQVVAFDIFDIVTQDLAAIPHFCL